MKNLVEKFGWKKFGWKKFGWKKFGSNSSKLATKKSKFKEKSQKNKIKYVCKSHKLSLNNTLGKVSTTKISFTWRSIFCNPNKLCYQW